MLLDIREIDLINIDLLWFPYVNHNSALFSAKCLFPILREVYLAVHSIPFYFT